MQTSNFRQASYDIGSTKKTLLEYNLLYEKEEKYEVLGHKKNQGCIL